MTGNLQPLGRTDVADANRSPLPSATTTPSTTRLVLTVDAREYGGAEAYVSRLLEHLPDTYLCTLLATSPVPRQLRDAARERGAGLVLIPRVDSKFDMVGQLRLIRALRSTAPQLVHVNMADAANHRFALGAAHLLRRPAVATVHAPTAVFPGIQGFVLGAVFRRLRGAIAVSDEIATHLNDRLGIPRWKVRTVSNGVPVATMIDRANRRAGPVRVAVVGRLSAEKGVDVLVRAVAELVGQGRPVEAIIAGEGPARPELERLAEGLPVRFVGFVEEMEGFLHGVDILAVPSVSEGLPFTLLEGMMSGLPCVATAVGNMPQALGETGVIVPPNDPSSLARALDELVRSPDRRMALGLAAHERACTRYSMRSMVEATTRVYENALAG